MAGLSATLDFDTGFVNKLFNLIPELNGGFLGFVGARSRTLLKQQLLSGQEINVFGAGKGKRTKDAIGRNLVNSDVNKTRTETKIYSYPANLFEHGRTLRDGTREQPKEIITVKLKQMVSSNMVSYTNIYEKRMQKDLDKI
jgi:hypothetical protein